MAVSSASPTQDARDGTSAAWRTVGSACALVGFLLSAMLCSFFVFSVLGPLGFAGVFVPFGAVGPGIPVSWNAEPYTEDTIFDDTWFTWGTDYGIAVLCFVLAALIAQSPASPLRWPSAALMLAYSLSTLVGGLAHHLLPKSLNSSLFWAAWCVCVGFVALAGGLQLWIGRAFMLMCTRESALPILSRAVCFGYGGLLVLGVVLGFFRTHRPAADIFLLGIAQTPSSVYICFSLLYVDQFSPWSRVRFVLSIMTMAPTVLVYPALVTVTNFHPGHINCFLHVLLVIGWGGQGLSLLGFCRATEHGAKAKHA